MGLSSDKLTPWQIEVARKFKSAIRDGDIPALREAFSAFPEIIDSEPLPQPWMCMAASKSPTKILQALHEMGANPNLTGYGGEDGSNALGTAASYGNVHNVAFLLSIGTEIDQSRITRDPIFSGISGQSTEVVALLIEAGADPTIRYTDTARHGPYVDAMTFALERGEREIARMIALHRSNGDREAAQKLLDEAWRVTLLNIPGPDDEALPPPPQIDGLESVTTFH